MTELHLWVDIFRAAETWKVNSAVMGFKVVEIFGHGSTEILYRNPSGDVTNDLSQAEIWLRGDVKFDGCINCEVQPGGLANFCGLNDVRTFSTVFERLFKVAKETGILTDA